MKNIFLFYLINLIWQQCLYLKSNFTSADVSFLGHTDKDKYVEDGRFVITKVFVKIPSANDNESDDSQQKKKKKKRSVADTESVVGEPDDLKVISKGVLEGKLNDLYIYLLISNY